MQSTVTLSHLLLGPEHSGQTRSTKSSRSNEKDDFRSRAVDGEHFFCIDCVFSQATALHDDDTTCLMTSSTFNIREFVPRILLMQFSSRVTGHSRAHDFLDS